MAPARKQCSGDRTEAFWKEHPQAEGPLRNWYTQMKKAAWKNFAELRIVLQSADQVGHHTVFNIGGNKYRLATYINYRTGKVYIRDVMTHEEYSREDWKKR